MPPKKRTKSVQNGDVDVSTPKKKRTKKTAASEPSSKSVNSPMKVNARGEVLQIRSPAEFFAENQNIAGFDNPGKSMYTTIRELVENALDAAESIHVLPTIEISIKEMNADQFNAQRGLKEHKRVDHDLYSSGNSSKKKRKSLTSQSKVQGEAQDPSPSPEPSPPSGSEPKSTKKTPSKNKEVLYYRIRCKDNGAGMRHEKIPDMLGRVLAGSKYGVRQTRGKFGLGAKMALIWSKKSTGMPIEIRSAFRTRKDVIPTTVSYCKLDIDIYKNEPKIHEHRKDKNKEDDAFIGTEILLTISGSWTTYKSRVMQYLQQLAIITPYAEFSVDYECCFSPQKSFSIRYERRSTQMPPLAVEVKHHPSALNDLLLKQLIDHSKHDRLDQFLLKDLSGIDKALAARLIEELGGEFESSTSIKSLTIKQVHQIVSFFRQVEFKAPNGKHLSCAGEYNLRLGIIKELDPTYVATHTEQPAVFEGHSFIVEAGVSIGGKNVKEGINVYRFANRIPLLFEAGGDVVTRTAMKQINWSSYKVDHKRDRIGVFVSIVSTKIPFKGTGKEYIGDDIREMKKAVKHVLQQCCVQLRTKLLKSSQMRENQQRKKNLSRYIPDVVRSMVGMLEQMQERSDTITSAEKRALVSQFKAKELTDKTIRDKLKEAVNKADQSATLEQIHATGRDKSKEQKVYILPLDEESRDFSPHFFHPNAQFKFFTDVLCTPS